MTTKEALAELAEAWAAGVYQELTTNVAPETVAVPYEAFSWAMAYIQALEGEATALARYANVDTATITEPHDQLQAVGAYLRETNGAR